MPGFGSSCFARGATFFYDQGIVYNSKGAVGRHRFYHTLKWPVLQQLVELQNLVVHFLVNTATKRNRNGLFVQLKKNGIVV